MRKKLQRFSDNAASYNVVERGKDNYDKIKGHWSDHFKNDHPLVVELGCGRGEYTVGLAERDAMRNYIGVDIKGSRIWVGSNYAQQNNLDNVAFLRTKVQQIDEFFAVDEISEIWITFPDPRPRDGDEKRRLTYPGLMEKYRQLLRKDGWVKFKTDNTDLFDYTLEMINTDQIKVRNLSHTHDLYNSEFNEEHFGLKTKYEGIFTAKGEKIKYMKFQFSE
ncbi:MAG: tRNA (guanosine(46)-N7)-methyltransferase TrmB [Cyclobacteriaceae bacterium]